MKSVTQSVGRITGKSGMLPSFVQHESFEQATSSKAFDPKLILAAVVNYDDKYMPDEITKDHARLMHYAAYRIHRATTSADYRKWHQRYVALRDRVVLGNRKLIYQAVRRRMGVSNYTDDLIGDCQIVLIQAVAVFNPWLGIRFSTYAYTCLVRALSRRAQKFNHDWLHRALPLMQMPQSEPQIQSHQEPFSSGQFRIDEFLREDHPLLTAREKQILTRRFCLEGLSRVPTLEKVGQEIGLSKERVRQVQTVAIQKLRTALGTVTE